MERGSTIVTSNRPFEEWTSVFGSQRLTAALLDRLTHHVQILELNGETGSSDVEEADRIDFELLLRRLASLDIRQLADAVALQTAVQRGSRQMRDGRLQELRLRHTWPPSSDFRHPAEIIICRTLATYMGQRGYWMASSSNVTDEVWMKYIEIRNRTSRMITSKSYWAYRSGFQP